MKILYFTATGNSLYVARNIGGELLSIPQMIKEERYHFVDDKIGIVMPIYGFDMPKIIKRFLEKATFDTDYLFVVGTFGDHYGCFGDKVSKLLATKNLTPDYINVIKMVDNALHAGYEISNQLETLKDKHVEEHLKAIVDDINVKRSKIIEPLKKEKMVSPIVYLTAPLMDKFTGSRALRVDEKCIECGICLKVCPVQNISCDEKVTIGKKCELCLACLHNCPSKAIHIKMEKSDERFRNEHITLAEIIASNNQF